MMIRRGTDVSAVVITVSPVGPELPSGPPLLPHHTHTIRPLVSIDTVPSSSSIIATNTNTNTNVLPDPPRSVVEDLVHSSMAQSPMRRAIGASTAATATATTTTAQSISSQPQPRARTRRPGLGLLHWNRLVQSSRREVLSRTNNIPREKVRRHHTTSTMVVLDGPAGQCVSPESVPSWPTYHPRWSRSCRSVSGRRHHNTLSEVYSIRG